MKKGYIMILDKILQKISEIGLWIQTKLEKIEKNR